MKIKKKETTFSLCSFQPFFHVLPLHPIPHSNVISTVFIFQMSNQPQHASKIMPNPSQIIKPCSHLRHYAPIHLHNTYDAPLQPSCQINPLKNPFKICHKHAPLRNTMQSHTFLSLHVHESD